MEGGAGAGLRAPSAPPRGILEQHARGPQGHSAGGGCRSAGLVREALGQTAGEDSDSVGWRLVKSRL
jgi:hypothetical protein